MIAKNRSYAAITVVCLMLIAGCATREESGEASNQIATESSSMSDPTSPDQDSLVAFLTGTDHASLGNAFAEIDRLRFTRYQRTEQFDADDELIAYEEEVTRHEGPPSDRRYVRLDGDSSGQFDFGYLDRFVSKSVVSKDPTDLARFVIPDEPAYLSPRNRDAYSFHSLPDTQMSGITARVIEVRARPDEGDDQNIRLARLYVDRDRHRLIAAYLERSDAALWYREESSLYVRVRPGPTAAWVPDHTRFETRIGVPFRPRQRFRTISRYDAYVERSD